MKNIRSYFVFNRSQQNGIFLLVAIIIILQLIYLFIDFSPAPSLTVAERQELERFQKQLDSLKLVASEKDSVRIFPFNPNFITDYRGYTLGMSTEEIDRLHNFRSEDKWINSAEEFQQVTGVSDSLLLQISPYFQFPEWVNSSRERTAAVARVEAKSNAAQKRDLNTATVEDLRQVKGVGEVLGGRIVNYRNKIGGYVNDLQLKDIYGLNFETREAVQNMFTVKTPAPVKVIDINEASVLELSNVPYINYELAREIVNYRLLHEKISTFEELAKIKEFPSEKIDRIALYLTLK